MYEQLSVTSHYLLNNKYFLEQSQNIKIYQIIAHTKKTFECTTKCITSLDYVYEINRRTSPIIIWV
jgi:hypothetical protein